MCFVAKEEIGEERGGPRERKIGVGSRKRKRKQSKSKQQTADKFLFFFLFFVMLLISFLFATKCSLMSDLPGQYMAYIYNI